MRERSGDRSDRRHNLRTDARGVTPAVGKALEVTLVVLLLGVLTTTLFSGVVPRYRSTAANDVARRTLVAAGQRIQQAVPPATASARAHVRVDLPRTIRGNPYRVRANGRALVLVHPNDDVEARVPLALPANATIRGEWTSDRTAWIDVKRTPDATTITLTNASRVGNASTGADR